MLGTATGGRDRVGGPADRAVEPGTRAAETASGRPAAPWGALALTLLVCLLAVVAATGPALSERSAVTVVETPETGAGDEMGVDNPPLYSDPIERDKELRPDFASADWIGAALVCAVAVVALALLVPRLLRALRQRDRPEEAGDGVAIAGASSLLDVGRAPEVPVLMEGARAAEQLLDDVQDPRDAVVAAWLALEAAAAGSGASRQPAQTPTEFTTTVLDATGADREAVDTLLRLYLRARFTTAGRRTTGAADVAAARAALATLSESWVRRRG
ncbi:DUF4129 domain-containing protein [Georgenia subflava]|uniref:DUF4129 domain-containing protein n=1 Tax=Georgenia subflava TaxID=1622177 RepID=A0A6N7EJC3_9MICO|nr:DUF4129 domain-containing protein [Georgenia subflava]MPV38492.1 DUF4129 domain-containing protein [Georgenia subflava]